LQIAKNAGVKFDELLELIAIDFIFNAIDKKSIQDFKEIFVLIDDELLAMHLDFADATDSIEWVESVFRQSLALIQANANEQKMFISILNARTNGILRRMEDRTERQRSVSTGIPFSVAQAIITYKDKFRAFGEKFITEWTNGNQSPVVLAKYVEAIEKWASKNALVLLGKNPVPQSTLDSIRQDWLYGIDLASIIAKDIKAGNAVKDYYGFTMPWVLHAISQVFDEEQDEDISGVFSVLALLVELGLPNGTAANIFLAGIRSRSAALEFSSFDCMSGKSAIEIKAALLLMPDAEKNVLSDKAKSWLKNIEDIYKALRKRRVSFPEFTLGQIENNVVELLVRKYQGAYYLVSPNGYYQCKVETAEDLPFADIANISSLYFELENDAWVLKSYDPRIVID
jgi:hypothetical protein